MTGNLGEEQGELEVNRFTTLYCRRPSPFYTVVRRYSGAHRERSQTNTDGNILVVDNPDVADCRYLKAYLVTWSGAHSGI